MVITDKDLYNGLLIYCDRESELNKLNYIYVIKDLKKGILYSSYYNKEYDNYYISTILEKINNKHWQIIHNQQKIYELW